jgi:hypothetical protein
MNLCKRREHECRAVLEEILRTARERHAEAARAQGDSFEQGRAFAYHYILGIAKEQAARLGLDLAGMGLAGKGGEGT